MQKTISELITLANKLDSLGLKKEADELDDIIKSAMDEDVIERLLIERLLKEWREADKVELSRELGKEEEERVKDLTEQAIGLLSESDR